MRYCHDMQEVALYAAARHAFGASYAQYDAANLGELIELISSKNEAIAKLLPTCSFLVNSVAQTERKVLLHPGDQIDVLPQFAGG